MCMSENPKAMLLQEKRVHKIAVIKPVEPEQSLACVLLAEYSCASSKKFHSSLFGTSVSHPARGDIVIC